MHTQPDLQPIVVVATDQELPDKHYYRRLWIAARNYDISRRRWLDAIAAAIYEFRGHILKSDGSPWPIPEVDDVMGEAGGRWISYWFEESDGEPKREVRCLERVRLFDLYFRIAHPDIARHFAR